MLQPIKLILLHFQKWKSYFLDASKLCRDSFALKMLTLDQASCLVLGYKSNDLKYRKKAKEHLKKQYTYAITILFNRWPLMLNIHERNPFKLITYPDSPTMPSTDVPNSFDSDDNNNDDSNNSNNTSANNSRNNSNKNGSKKTETWWYGYAILRIVCWILWKKLLPMKILWTTAVISNNS